MPIRDRETYNAYMRKYMRDRMVRRRTQAIKQLGGKCVNCGSIENLEFDHVNQDPDPRTRRGRGSIWTFSEERFQAELAKCQLLCRDCHKQKTLNEISAPHGGGLSGKKNCTCTLCRNKKAEYMALRWERLKGQ